MLCLSRSLATASRTIVLHHTLPELTPADWEGLEHRGMGWVHIEGTRHASGPVRVVRGCVPPLRCMQACARVSVRVRVCVYSRMCARLVRVCATRPSTCGSARVNVCVWSLCFR